MSTNGRDRARPAQNVPRHTVSQLALGRSSTQLELQDAVCGGQHTLILSGELDLSSAPVLGDVIAEVCIGAATAVVLDMRRLTFIDVCGTNAIFDAKQRCTEHGRDFFVIPGEARVMRVFALSGLLDELPFQIDESDVDSVLSGNVSENRSAS